MRLLLLLAVMASSALAFPIMDNPEISEAARELWERYQIFGRDLSSDPLGISKAQTNCGQVRPYQILGRKD